MDPNNNNSTQKFFCEQFSKQLFHCERCKNSRVLYYVSDPNVGAMCYGCLRNTLEEGIAPRYASLIIISESDEIEEFLSIKLKSEKSKEEQLEEARERYYNSLKKLDEEYKKHSHY